MTEEKDDWDEFLEATGTASEETHFCRALKDDLQDYCGEPATVPGRTIADLFQAILPESLIVSMSSVWYCEECAEKYKEGFRKEIKRRYADK